MDLPPFTLIGATNPCRQPFLRRCAIVFGIIERLQFFIPLMSWRRSLISTPRHSRCTHRVWTVRASSPARSSRARPRIANRLLNRVRDFCSGRRRGRHQCRDSRATPLDRLEVDEAGLDKLDRGLALGPSWSSTKAGPVGLDTLAASIGEERVTLEDVCEPYLLQEGFLARDATRDASLQKKPTIILACQCQNACRSKISRETLFINEEGEEDNNK